MLFLCHLCVLIDFIYMFFKRPLEPHSLWCPLGAVAEWNHRLIVCYITVGWRDAHFQNHHAALCAGEPLHLVSQTHFHAAQSKERNSFETKVKKFPPQSGIRCFSEQNTSGGGHLTMFFPRSKESSNMSRVALNVVNNVAEGQNLNPRSSLNRKSQTRAKITPHNSAKSDTTFRLHGSPSVLRFTHWGQLTHPAGSEGDMFRC